MWIPPSKLDCDCAILKLEATWCTQEHDTLMFHKSAIAIRTIEQPTEIAHVWLRMECMERPLHPWRGSKQAFVADDARQKSAGAELLGWAQQTQMGWRGHVAEAPSQQWHPQTIHSPDTVASSAYRREA
jgi:hypothetical protein